MTLAKISFLVCQYGVSWDRNIASCVPSGVPNLSLRSSLLLPFFLAMLRSFQFAGPRCLILQSIIGVQNEIWPEIAKKSSSDRSRAERSKALRICFSSWPSGQARWPQAVTRLGLPQTRTCSFRAYGSSHHGLAARAYTER